MKTGFYWIKLNGQWTIAFYTDHDCKYRVAGRPWTYASAELDEIDYREIINPNIK